MRRFSCALAVAALLVLTGSSTAFAVDEGTTDGVQESTTQSSTDGYGPPTPREPSLAGSSVVPTCERDVPWIDFSVTLTDPDNASTGHTARLVMTDGTNVHTIELGTLVDNQLRGRVLWPGGAVGADGRGDGWPGWVKNDAGAWVETDGNFAWTRGEITTTIEVNPSIPVALSYPPASPECATGPLGLSDGAGGLASSGLGAAVLPLAAVGGAAVIAGVVFLVVRRRRVDG